MIINSVSIYIDLVEKIIEFIENRRRKQKALNTPLGETLRKVETAQEHLTDALDAIDVIKEQVVTERNSLDNLLKEVEEKRKLYDATNHDLETAQNLLEQDHDKLKRALGLNSSREKFIGFISGVFASIIATGLWYLGAKIIEIINKQ